VLVLETTDLSGYVIESLPVKAAANSEYVEFYSFGGQTYKAGTLIRVYAGSDPGENPDDFEHVHLFAEKGVAAFVDKGESIRLKNGRDEILHTLPVYRARAYSKFSTNIIRNQDGTRFFIFVKNTGSNFTDLKEGIFRISFTFKRNIGNDFPVFKRFGFTDAEATSLEFTLPAILP